MPRTLDVWYNENKAGRLIQDDSGRLGFTYERDYLGSSQAWPLSISLPLREEEFEDRIVRPFFSGFLPDDAMRKKLAQRLGVSDKNPFALLESVGGECAGAISLYPAGTPPHKENPSDVKLLEGAAIDETITILRGRPLLAGEGGVRLSLAGAQDKLAVRLIDDKIALMLGGAPTTHILKPMITGRDDISDSVQNELFCTRLAQRIGIPVPRAEMRFTPAESFLLVERYDRERTNQTVVRLHQEDFCQAMSIPPENKYESEGGPSIKRCLGLIQNYSVQPMRDRITFLDVVIFNYLIGNSDAHGKNFSFLYRRGKPSLAPFYDLLSTAVYPDLDSKMAMKIGGKYQPNEVYLRHWLLIVPETSTARKSLEKDLTRMARTTLEQSKQLKAELQEEGIASPIFDSIISIVESRAANLLRGLGEDSPGH